jgi:hypothetical protein
MQHVSLRNALFEKAVFLQRALFGRNVSELGLRMVDKNKNALLAWRSGIAAILN